MTSPVVPICHLYSSSVKRPWVKWDSFWGWHSIGKTVTDSPWSWEPAESQAVPNYCCDWSCRVREVSACGEGRVGSATDIQRFRPLYKLLTLINCQSSCALTIFFFCEGRQINICATRLSEQTGRFWVDQGWCFSSQHMPQIDWKLIYMRIEDVDRWWKISLPPFSILSPLEWLRGVRNGWVILDNQDCWGGEPVHQGTPLPITLHEKRNMAKSLWITSLQHSSI